MASDAKLIAWCTDAVTTFIDRQSEERDRLASLQQLLGHPPGPLTDRRTLPGHLTASGIVFDPIDQFVLLLHHKALNRWLQPGGHVDAGEMPLQAARREVLEETGIVVGPVSSPKPARIEPVDIDSHSIPANPRKGEPAHTHHDFRFAFPVDRAKQPLNLAADEVVDAAWMSVNDPRFPQDLMRCVGRVFGSRLFVVDE